MGNSDPGSCCSASGLIGTLPPSTVGDMAEALRKETYAPRVKMTHTGSRGGQAGAADPLRPRREIAISTATVARYSCADMNWDGRHRRSRPVSDSNAIELLADWRDGR